MSKPGRLCENPVNSSKACKDIATNLSTVDYVSLRGDGHDLPHGCIFDNLTLIQHRVYWNPKGVSLSADKNVRQVCMPCEGYKKGKYLLTIFRSDFNCLSNL